MSRHFSHKEPPKRYVVGAPFRPAFVFQQATIGHPKCYHCGTLLTAKGKMQPNICQPCLDKRKK